MSSVQTWFLLIDTSISPHRGHLVDVKPAPISENGRTTNVEKSAHVHGALEMVHAVIESTGGHRFNMHICSMLCTMSNARRFKISDSHRRNLIFGFFIGHFFILKRWF